MKISTSYIRIINKLHHSAGDPAPKGIDDLVQKIGAQLAAVEEVISYGERFRGIVIVKVISCESHSNADKLHLCKIDDGGVTKNIARDSKGLIQVVCGAPNVRAGLLAAWIPPGVVVPATIGDDPLTIEVRHIRGEVSYGMLASPHELTIGGHEGILEIDDAVRPGTMFDEAFDLKDDYVIDMENKMFTHRPDLFGQLGIARELEGIQHRPYKSPNWYTQNPRFPDVETEALPLEVKNELPKLVPRFSAITMGDVEVKPSPVWLKIALSRVGIRPINNIVDYTNYFMIETAQPLHAYDYDKLKALDGKSKATITIRYPRKGESITLLGGKTITPRSEAIMIASATKLIGIGGVMGGADTEVDEHTKNIVLECANFDMYSIRRTAMEHGLFTDAVTRFTKGQSPLQNLAVLAKIVDEIRRYANGKVAGKVIDNKTRLPAPRAVKVTPQFINARLGLNLSAQKITTLLSNVEFKVMSLSGGHLAITPPFWRMDIEIPEDIVEEVGRLYGYDNVPLELPNRNIAPAPLNPMFELKKAIRERLSQAGANELLTYSFAHGNLIDQTGQDKKLAFKLANALSPDLQYYRMSLTPSLLEKVHPNVKLGYGEFALFEIGKTHVKGEVDPKEPGVPKEVNALGFVYVSDSKMAVKHDGAPYYQAHLYFNNLLEIFGVTESFSLESLHGADLYNNPWLEQITAPYEPKRSAVLRDANGLVWGVVGEFKGSVRKSLKLPDFSAGFELDPLLFLLHGQKESRYRPIPRFPYVEQDLSVKVPAEVSYGDLSRVITHALNQKQPANVLSTLQPVDIYQADEATYKHVTFRLRIASYDRTLTAAEVNTLLDEVALEAHEKLKAERI